MSVNAVTGRKRNQSKFFKRAAIVLSAALALYAAVCAVLYFIQDRLIFWPQPVSAEAIAMADKQPNADSIELAMKDGTKIRGWLVKADESAKPGLLIYFGGNAEEVSRLIGKFSQFRQWDVALMNYRGYGESEGRPGESAMFSDSLEIYDSLCLRNDIDNGKIVVMGRSIGTGVAAYLAANRKVSSVILVSPYDSLTSLVQEKYPLIPAGLLLKNRFDTVGRAPGIKAPLLVVTGSEDTTIPAWHSEKVAESWGGPVSRAELAGDHNTLSAGAAYWDTMEGYLDGLRK